MRFTIRPNKPPYYVRRPHETLLRYMRRVIKDIVQMCPYARVHGIRYFFDTDFRRKISNRRRSLNRRQREGTFHSKRVKRRLKAALVERDGQRCNSCFKPFDLHLLSIDHIIPLYALGDSELDNLQLLCMPCHGHKCAVEQQLFKAPG